MLDTNQVAEVLERTPASVRVLLHRRGQMEQTGVLPDGRRGLLAGVIPAPSIRLGVSPGWDEFDVLRFRAYSEGGRMAARAEGAVVQAHLIGNAACMGSLLSVLRYPDDVAFLDRLAEVFESEVA